MTTVYVVDDDEGVRDAIGLLLQTVDLPYEAFADAQAFLDALATRALTGCLVLDIRMPGMSGLDLQERLKAMGVEMPIIFITGHGDVPMAVQAMRRGAVDFIRKPFRDQELLDRIHEALDQERKKRLESVEVNEARRLIDTLTPREHEVFERVVAGQANKVTALDLGISERTVEIHRGQVMRKTQCRSLAELVRLSLVLERAEGGDGP